MEKEAKHMERQITAERMTPDNTAIRNSRGWVVLRNRNHLVWIFGLADNNDEFNTSLTKKNLPFDRSNAKTSVFSIVPGRSA